MSDLTQYIKVRDQAAEMAARQGVTHFVNNTRFGYQVSAEQGKETEVGVLPNGDFIYPGE